MLRATLAGVLLAVCMHAAAQEATETSLDSSSPYAGMSDDELVSAFLSPKLGSNRSGDKKHPKTGVPMNMDALNELFQRHPEWHWQQVLSWEVAPGMTEHEVMIAWGKPKKVNEREEGDVWAYRTKFPPSGFYLEFNPDGTLAQVRD